MLLVSLEGQFQTETIADSPTNTNDLSQIIQEAQPGATIELDGTYTLSNDLEIDKPLILKGSGRDTTRLQIEGSGPIIRFAADGTLELTGLTLTHIGTETANVLEMTNGTLTIQHSLVEGAVADENGEGGRGLWLENSTATIIDVIFQNNDISGLEASGQSQLTITDSLFQINGIGLRLFSESSSTISSSQFLENASDGLEAGNNAVVKLEQTTFQSNGANGISLSGRANAKIQQSTIAKNLTGVLVEENATLSITNTTLSENQQLGVYFVDSSTGLVEGNTFEKNLIGIVAEGSATPTIATNQFSGNEQDVQTP